MFLNFDVGQLLIFDESFSDHNRVFKVVTAPWHEGYEQVATECQFAGVDTGTIGDDLTGFDLLSEQQPMGVGREWCFGWCGRNE